MIRTYGNQLISRWQSALYKVLTQDAMDRGEEPITDLGTEHPAMAASCLACDEIQQDMGHEDHHHPPESMLAEPVGMTDLVKECARLYVGLLAARMSGNQARITELENEVRYSVCDPMWAKALFEFHKGDENQIPYRRYESMDDFVIPLPDPDPISGAIKVAFVSDWATGTAIAHNVMRCIGESKPDLVIHLGDIYYSGTRKECEENFLNVVRKYIPESIPVYTLAGNHDLYAGGEGYYWLLDQLGQPASYFCLRNDDWQILAVGAPTDNHNPGDVLESVPPIDEQELLWHYHKIANSMGRKTVMLSHYQLFTASGNIARNDENKLLAVNPILYAAFKEYLEDIDLWLWGHEHNFIVFEPYLGLERGRCIGSGALPVPLLWQPYRTRPDLLWPPQEEGPPRMNPYARLGHDGDHYHHGYGVLTLTGNTGEMSYYQVAGTTGGAEIIYREEI